MYSEMIRNEEFSFFVTDYNENVYNNFNASSSLFLLNRSTKCYNGSLSRTSYKYKLFILDADIINKYTKCAY